MSKIWKEKKSQSLNKSINYLSKIVNASENRQEKSLRKKLKATEIKFIRKFKKEKYAI